MQITKRHVGYMLVALSCGMVVAAFAGFYSLLLPAIVPAFLGLGSIFNKATSKQGPGLFESSKDTHFDDISGLNGALARERATLGAVPAFNLSDPHDL